MTELEFPLDGIHKDPQQVWAHMRPYVNLSTISQACGVQRQSVFQWLSVPVKHARTVHYALGTPLSILRPDLFAAGRTEDFVKAVPLGTNYEDDAWGLERVNYPGIIVAHGMTRDMANMWIRWINSNAKKLHDIDALYTS